MSTPSGPELLLVVVGSAMMVYVVLSAIGRTAIAVASNEIADRRARETRRRAEDAAAEAAGRAASMEPLNLNPDGSIEEPLVAMVEDVVR